MSAPNILWIVTTQWRAQALGSAGDAQARTPNLDAFAFRAKSFRQAVTPHPFGPFARAAMLTGVPSPENGVADYFDALPMSTRTVAHALSECGYHTAFFGKWHLGRRDPAVALVGPDHAKAVVPEVARGGFRFWEGFESGFQLNDPWMHGTRLPEPTRFSGYQSDIVCERASEYLDGCTLEPWFAMVSLEAPHPPYDAPAPCPARLEPAEIALGPNVPRGGEVEARARKELAGYYRHIAATDQSIGRLLQRIQKANTKVVFTSVHGDMHGAHGHFRKGWPFEESVGVPLLIFDASLGAGMDDRPISLLELPAIARAWAGGEPWPARLQRSAISMPSVVHLPWQCDRRWSGWRSPARKLILNAAGEPWLYFDLENDRYEQRNLVGEPAYAEDLRRFWREPSP